MTVVILTHSGIIRIPCAASTAFHPSAAILTEPGRSRALAAGIHLETKKEMHQ